MNNHFSLAELCLNPSNEPRVCRPWSDHVAATRAGTSASSGRTNVSGCTAFMVCGSGWIVRNTSNGGSGGVFARPFTRLSQNSVNAVSGTPPW